MAATETGRNPYARSIPCGKLSVEYAPGRTIEVRDPVFGAVIGMDAKMARWVANALIVAADVAEQPDPAEAAV